MAATPEDMKLGQSLIQRLDAEPDRPGTTVRPFPLVKADATAVKTMIDNLNKTTGTRRSGRRRAVGRHQRR